MFKGDDYPNFIKGNATLPDEIKVTQLSVQIGQLNKTIDYTGGEFTISLTSEETKQLSNRESVYFKFNTASGWVTSKDYSIFDINNQVVFEEK